MTTTQRAWPYITIWPGDRLEGRIDLREECVGFTCAKSLDQPAGQWTIQLLPRARVGRENSTADLRRCSELYRKIRPGAVVSIGMDEPGGIMAGQVARVTWSRSMVGQTVQHGLTISGFDFGQLFVQDSIIKASVSVSEFAAFKEKVEAALGNETPVLFDLPGTWGPTTPLGDPQQGDPGAAPGGDANLRNVRNTRDPTPAFEGRSVQDVISWALRHAPSVRVPLMAAATGGTGRPFEFIGTTHSVTTWNEGRIWGEHHAEYEGAVWGFLRSILDVDFYEITLQSLPNPNRGRSKLADSGARLPRLELVVRPKPFDSRALQFAPTREETGLLWEDLRTLVDGLENHDVALDEVFRVTLGCDNAQVFSYYTVVSKTDLLGNPSALGEGFAYPLLDTYWAKHFGMKAYQAQLALVGGDVARKVDATLGTGDYDSEISAEVAEFRNRLFNWYRLNPWFETGSISVVGRDRFRPGDPVRLPWAEASLTVPSTSKKIRMDPGMRYYCPQVSWQWSYGQPYTCDLVLTRGANASMIEAAKALILDDAPALNPPHYVAL